MPNFLEEKCNLFLSKFTFVYLQSNRLFLMAFCYVLVYLQGFHIYCISHYELQFIMSASYKRIYIDFFLVQVLYSYILIYLYCLFYDVLRLHQTIVKSNLTYFTFKYLIYKSLLRYKLMNDRKLSEDYVDQR